MAFKHFFLIVLSFIMSTSAFAQRILYDKTSNNGRLIITDTEEVYEYDRQEGRLGLLSLTTNNSTQYFISISSEEKLSVHAGYKLLLKHKDESITELTCVFGGVTLEKTYVSNNFFGLSIETLKNTGSIIYSVSKEQLQKIEESPVMKIRIEQELEYSDRDTGFFNSSHFSSAVAYGHKKILEALSTKKSGLYDNF